MTILILARAAIVTPLYTSITGMTQFLPRLSLLLFLAK